MLVGDAPVHLQVTPPQVEHPGWHELGTRSGLDRPLGLDQDAGVRDVDDPVRFAVGQVMRVFAGSTDASRAKQLGPISSAHGDITPLL